MKKVLILSLLVISSITTVNLYSMTTINEKKSLEQIQKFKDFSLVSHNSATWPGYLKQINTVINDIFYAKQNSKQYRKLALIDFEVLKELINIRNDIEGNLIFNTFKHKDVTIKLIENN